MIKNSKLKECLRKSSYQRVSLDSPPKLWKIWSSKPVIISVKLKRESEFPTSSWIPNSERLSSPAHPKSSFQNYHCSSSGKLSQSLAQSARDITAMRDTRPRVQSVSICFTSRRPPTKLHLTRCISIKLKSLSKTLCRDSLAPSVIGLIFNMPNGLTTGQDTRVLTGD